MRFLLQFLITGVAEKKEMVCFLSSPTKIGGIDGVATAITGVTI